MPLAHTVCPTALAAPPPPSADSTAHCACRGKIARPLELEDGCVPGSPCRWCCGAGSQPRRPMPERHSAASSLAQQPPPDVHKAADRQRQGDSRKENVEVVEPKRSWLARRGFYRGPHVRRAVLRGIQFVTPGACKSRAAFCLWVAGLGEGHERG